MVAPSSLLSVPTFSKRSARLLVFGLCTLVAGCSSAPQAVSRKPASQYTVEKPEARKEPQVVTTVETRQQHNRRVLAYAWQWVNSHYFDTGFNGVDWTAMREKHRAAIEAAGDEEQLYAGLGRMVSELGDLHTQIFSPHELADQHHTERTLLGFVTRPASGAENKLTIVGVMPGSPAASAGVQTGWVLDSCNGRPPGEVIAPGSLAPGQQVTCTFRDDADQIREVALAASEVSTKPIRESRALEDGYIYLRFDEFDSDAAAWLRQNLGAHADARGLIIDLRFNSGGEIAVLEDMLGNFFDQRVPVGSLVPRAGESDHLVSRREEGTAAFAGRVAVLVSEQSMSCAEIFSDVLQLNHRALVLGHKTAGLALGTVAIALPGGGELQLSVWDYRAPDGSRIDGHGVDPDIVLETPRDDSHAGVASGIAAALEALRLGALVTAR